MMKALTLSSGNCNKKLLLYSNIEWMNSYLQKLLISTIRGRLYCMVKKFFLLHTIQQKDLTIRIDVCPVS